MRELSRNLGILAFAIASALGLFVAGCGDDDEGGGDSTAPTVNSTTPASGATGVSLNGNIAVSFSEAMDPASISTSTFTLTQGAIPIGGAVTYSANPGATFDPVEDLQANTVYTASITTGATDLAGNPLAAPHTWSFTTGDAPDVTPPTVSSTTPDNDETGVSVTATISATFSEAIDPNTLTITSFVVTRGATVVDGDIAYSGVTGTFTPSSPLSPGAVHTVSITTAVTDLAGNPLAQAYVWGFTTGSDDVTAPTVVSTTPIGGATGVSLGSNISATFSEAMDLLSLTNTTFTLRHGAVVVSGTVTTVGAVATFNPNADLNPSADYTATITTGATDQAGNALAQNYEWSFTTGPAPDVTPPTVTVTVPENGASNVSTASNITATFSEVMNSATVEANFTLRQGATPIAGVVTYSGTTATFNPDVELSGSTLYTATIATGAQDLASNGLASQFSWSFTTGAGADVTPPTVISTVPITGATDISIGVAITATFSEDVNPLTISGSTFTLLEGVTLVSGTVTSVGSTATFTPNTTLAPGMQYTAIISTGVTDLAGNSLAAPFQWSFTTVASGDVIRPTVISTSPGDLATDVPTGTIISATFSEAMAPGSISPETFVVTSNGGADTVSGIWDYSGTTYYIDVGLATNTLYTATITTGATDLAGNGLLVPHSWTFTTLPSPAVVSTVPASDASNISIGANVTATFNRAMDALTITTATFTLKQGVTPIAGTVTYSGLTAVFNPNVNLSTSTVYTATITTGAADPAGNAVSQDYSWNFTTGSSNDATPPVVVSTLPGNGANNVSIATTIRATFSEAMDPSTLTTVTFTVKAGTAPKVGTVTYQGTTATFTPFSWLAPGTVYTATITTGAMDISGNAVAQNKVWTFTTGP